MHRSPAEILEQLSPPGLILRLSFNDHRFKVEAKAAVLHLLGQLHGPWRLKSRSSSFAADQSTWAEALRSVHQHAWHWHDRLVAAGFDEMPQTRQEPGQIDQALIDQLAGEVEKMPPPKKYLRGG